MHKIIEETDTRIHQNVKKISFARISEQLVLPIGPNGYLENTVVLMDTLKIQNILKLHNTMRNQIALGQIKNYATAAKMPVMVRDFLL